MSTNLRPPFRQSRFADLPALPRRPHAYYESEALELVLEEGPFAGTKVHVRRLSQSPTGEPKPPLFLVHGLMTSSYSWRYVLAPLAVNYTCYAVDLPGNGRSDAPQEPAYSAANLADWLALVQRELGIRGCPVVANSMGGYLCMHLALRDPESMSCLVNLHSPGVPELRLSMLAAALAIPGMQAFTRWLIRRKPHEWAHRNVHYYDESLKSLEEAREYGEPLSSPEGAHALVKYLKETMAQGPMRELHRALRERREGGHDFPVPLQLLYADRDPMVPPRFGDVFAAAIPSAEFVSLPEASHFAHVDATERFLPPVLKFLAAAPHRDRHAAHRTT